MDLTVSFVSLNYANHLYRDLFLSAFLNSVSFFFFSRFSEVSSPSPVANLAKLANPQEYPSQTRNLPTMQRNTEFRNSRRNHISRGGLLGHFRGCLALITPVEVVKTTTRVCVVRFLVYCNGTVAANFLRLDEKSVYNNRSESHEIFSSFTF